MIGVPLYRTLQIAHEVLRSACNSFGISVERRQDFKRRFEFVLREFGIFSALDPKVGSHRVFKLTARPHDFFHLAVHLPHAFHAEHLVVRTLFNRPEKVPCSFRRAHRIRRHETHIVEDHIKARLPNFFRGEGDPLVRRLRDRNVCGVRRKFQCLKERSTKVSVIVMPIRRAHLNLMDLPKVSIVLRVSRLHEFPLFDFGMCRGKERTAIDHQPP